MDLVNNFYSKFPCYGETVNFMYIKFYKYPSCKLKFTKHVN